MERLRRLRNNKRDLYTVNRYWLIVPLAITPLLLDRNIDSWGWKERLTLDPDSLSLAPWFLPLQSLQRQLVLTELSSSSTFPLSFLLGLLIDPWGLSATIWDTPTTERNGWFNCMIFNLPQRRTSGYIVRAIDIAKWMETQSGLVG